MNGLIVVPLVIMFVAGWLGIGYLIADTAYERGYDDACADWRSLPPFDEHGFLEAKVADDLLREAGRLN